MPSQINGVQIVIVKETTMLTSIIKQIQDI